MTRLSLLLAITLLLAAPPSVGGQIAPAAPELRALWVDAFHDGFKTRSQVDDLVEWARSAHANALFVQVRRRGDAYYARSLEPRAEDPDFEPGFDALQYLIERAHAGTRPLQVHAWLATLALWHKQDEPPVSPDHAFNQHGLSPVDDDTWLMLRDDGEAWTGAGGSGSYYLDPGHPDAARWTARMYLQVLENYDVDGIHLDHVRYFEGQGQDRRWGYNPRSVARFNSAAHREPGTQPEPLDPEWMAWRRDQVTALVRRIYLEAKALKPRAAVTAAVIAWGQGPERTGGWEGSAPYSAVFQDWRYWLEEGLLDVAIPMDYYREPTRGAWLDEWATFQAGNRGKRAVAIGLAGYLNEPAGLAAQLQRVRQLPIVGTAVYSYAVPSVLATGEETGARALAASTLRQWWGPPTAPPDLPWLTRPATGHLLVDVPGREGLQVVFRGPFGERVVTSDGTGMAALADVIPGRYTVSVQGQDVDPTAFDLDVLPGKTAVMRFAVPGV